MLSNIFPRTHVFQTPKNLSPFKATPAQTPLRESKEKKEKKEMLVCVPATHSNLPQISNVNLVSGHRYLCLPFPLVKQK